MVLGAAFGLLGPLGSIAPGLGEILIALNDRIIY
jgi:hypothetical protein